MMTTDIVSEIANLMRSKGVVPKDAKELKAHKMKVVPQDEVQLTKAGEYYANPVSSSSEYEKDQHMKVERLKALVAGGNYKMDEDLVDDIAARIAKMFL